MPLLSIVLFATCSSFVLASNSTIDDSIDGSTIIWIVVAVVLIVILIIGCTCYLLRKHLPCFGVISSIKDQSK
ncbi:hypothetical protein PMAYCL1PPCAC_02669, partial [Pristionchus mayeri]